MKKVTTLNQDVTPEVGGRWGLGMTVEGLPVVERVGGRGVERGAWQ